MHLANNPPNYLYYMLTTSFPMLYFNKKMQEFQLQKHQNPMLEHSQSLFQLIHKKIHNFSQTTTNSPPPLSPTFPHVAPFVFLLLLFFTTWVSIPPLHSLTNSSTQKNYKCHSTKAYIHELYFSVNKGSIILHHCLAILPFLKS